MNRLMERGSRRFSICEEFFSMGVVGFLKVEAT